MAKKKRDKKKKHKKKAAKALRSKRKEKSGKNKKVKKTKRIRRVKKAKKHKKLRSSKKPHPTKKVKKESRQRTKKGKIEPSQLRKLRHKEAPQTKTSSKTERIVPKKSFVEAEKEERAKPIIKTSLRPIAVVKKSPADNVLRPFNIIESYMGEYQFNDLFSVLFVCTGNMCRSPIAEGILKKKITGEIPEDLRPRFWVQSCGIFAYEGNKPSENAVRIGQSNQVDISSIRSKPLSRVLIEQSDLILALSIDHLNFIVENYPSSRNKTFLLKAFGKDRPLTISDSIPDPMGFSLEFYTKTFNEIQLAISDALPRIVEMARIKLEQTSTEP